MFLAVDEFRWMDRCEVMTQQSRERLPARREHITQSVRIAGCRRLYVSVDSKNPKELFLRVKGKDVTAEIVALHDALAICVALLLQNGVPLDRVVEHWVGIKVEPAGSVEGDTRIKFCSSSLDYIARHLLVHYGGRDDLAHVPKPEKAL